MNISSANFIHLSQRIGPNKSIKQQPKFASTKSYLTHVVSMNCNVFNKLNKVQAGSLLVSTLPMKGSKASGACEGVNPHGGR